MVVLDTGVLGGLTNPNPKSVTVKAMIAWAVRMRAAGHVFVIPAIASYEVRRELLRSGNSTSVAFLDSFCTTAPNLYLPLTDPALRRAAQLWADARNAAQPTAKDAALDGDVILTAQVLEENYAPGTFVVATDNLRHFQNRLPADLWTNIIP